MMEYKEIEMMPTCYDRVSQLLRLVDPFSNI